MAVHAGSLACGHAHRQRELAVGLEGRHEMRYPLVQRGRGPRWPRRHRRRGTGRQRRLLPALAAGLAAARPWLLAFAAVWGAAVIADSGVFSTLLSELADRRYLGTALTAQTAIGFR